jgi:pimeloyl-ACP methyl ester carboxylesterase
MVFWSLLTVVVVVLFIAYFLGPGPPVPRYDLELPTLPEDLKALESFIEKREQATPFLRPDNHGRIIWHEGKEYQKTPYVLVYLHGFSASYVEADPIHKEFAHRFSCHLYLPRLYAHGVMPPEPMLDFSAEKMVQSALEALAVASKLGDKVIIMAASTGATVGLYLAAHFPQICGLICFSPNIDLYSRFSFILRLRWGLYVARLVFWSKYREFEVEPQGKPYWTHKYRIEALIALKNLLATTMNSEVFKKITQPVFLGYYYENEDRQDKTVSVKKMLYMFRHLGTDPQKKWKRSFPSAGVHSISSRFTSKSWRHLRDESFHFAEKVLGLEPIEGD